MCGHSTVVIAMIYSKLQVSKRKSEIQDIGFEISVAQISAYIHDGNQSINQWFIY